MISPGFWSFAITLLKAIITYLSSNRKSQFHRKTRAKDAEVREVFADFSKALEAKMRAVDPDEVSKVPEIFKHSSDVGAAHPVDQRSFGMHKDDGFRRD